MSSATIQQILSTHWQAAFPTLGFITMHTRRVVNALMMCRTALLGAHRYECDSQQCGHTVLVNNSCRNRHCPTCQALARAEWLKQRLTQLLPTHYFHVVFTLPRELRPLVLKNKRALYRIMFTAASQTILTLCADPKRLGGKAGLILMLHTWTQRLTFHPHLHGIIPGGVLADDGQCWVAAQDKFFLPVKVVAAMFRGKFLALLKAAHAAGQVSWPANEFQSLVTALYRMRWHVFLQAPFRNPTYVIKYLAAYSNRVAIADKRIISVNDTHVRYRYEDRCGNGAIPRSEHIAGAEFIRRFVLHILPRGFVKIRYYGLLSNRTATTQLPVCLALLEKLRPLDAQWLRCAVATELLSTLSRASTRPCPVCGVGRLRIVERMLPALRVTGKGGND
jgi:hypothetical protein